MAIIKYSVAELQIETETPAWVKRSHTPETEARTAALEAEVAPEEEDLEGEDK